MYQKSVEVSSIRHILYNKTC